jgi:hypothetical protein
MTVLECRKNDYLINKGRIIQVKSYLVASTLFFFQNKGGIRPDIELGSTCYLNELEVQFGLTCKKLKLVR